MKLEKTVEIYKEIFGKLPQAPFSGLEGTAIKSFVNDKIDEKEFRDLLEKSKIFNS